MINIYIYIITLSFRSSRIIFASNIISSSAVWLDEWLESFFFFYLHIFFIVGSVYKIVNRWLDPPRNSIKEGRDTVHLPVIISNARETTLGICSGPYVRQSHARAPNLAQLFTECCCLAWKNNTSDLYGRFSKRPSSHFVLGFRLPMGPWLKIKPHNIWRGKVTGCNKTLEFN